MDPRVEAALKLFDLDSIEVMREPNVHDTKMLLGRGRNAIVLAFRGTASRAGCAADIQVCCTHYYMCDYTKRVLETIPVDPYISALGIAVCGCRARHAASF